MTEQLPSTPKWEKYSQEEAKKILSNAQSDQISSANIQISKWLTEKILEDTRFPISDRQNVQAYILKVIHSLSDEKKKEYLLSATSEYDEFVPLILVYLTMRGVAWDLALLRQDTIHLEHAVNTKHTENERKEWEALIHNSIF